MGGGIWWATHLGSGHCSAEGGAEVKTNSYIKSLNSTGNAKSGGGGGGRMQAR